MDTFNGHRLCHLNLGHNTFHGHSDLPLITTSLSGNGLMKTSYILTVRLYYDLLSKYVELEARSQVHIFTKKVKQHPQIGKK